MRKSLKLFLGILFLGVGICETFAAPPVDITNVEGRGNNKRIFEKPLTEDDITYTDGNKDSIGPPPNSGKVLFDLRGKSRPQRNGKDLLGLKAGEYVRVLKPSKDRRWYAIQILRGNRARAWVPRNAIEIPKTAASSAKSKSAARDDESEDSDE